jgi:hypothetical protein
MYNMLSTSGLVLDIYDDFRGEVVRSIYPSQESIPEAVKTASVLASEHRDRLPDDAFALVLLNNGEKLRKYACIDEGNTTLAVEFFLKTGHKLPVEAQKVAAVNLVQACGLFGITPPEVLEKVAVLGAMLTAIPAIQAAASVPGQVREHLQENELLGQGGRIITGNERAALHKTAADSNGGGGDGTADAPTNAPVGNNTTASKTVILKTARQLQLEKEAEEIAHLVFGHKGEKSVFPDDNSHDPVTGKNPVSEPQGKMFRPHVDVSSSEPPRVFHEKKAERLASPSQGKYPLDSYVDVQRASEYFDKYASAMAPATRREFCTNLVPRADELGIKVSSDARRYGATTYAPQEELKVAYRTRRHLCGDLEGLSGVLDELFDKVAEVEPELFAATLVEFDKVAGIDSLYDRQIPDPYFSTFGEQEKHATAKDDWSETIGNDYITESDLKRLARMGPRAFGNFKKDFIEEFRKDPVGIFSSLPRDQKIIIMRMQQSSEDTMSGTQTIL